MSRALCSSLIAVLALHTGIAQGADWSQFRGSQRDGTSAEIGLVGTWGEEGPPELWRRAIGAGYSGIVVIGERLYTMDADATNPGRPGRFDGGGKPRKIGFPRHPIPSGAHPLNRNFRFR